MISTGSPSPRAPALAVDVPSPLVGEGRGGGDCRAPKGVVPPTPNPSPQGGGESGWRLSWAVCTALGFALAPAPALAAGGGDVSPFVYQFMVFVVAIFVGY